MTDPAPQPVDTKPTKKRKVECPSCQFPHLGGCGTPLCPNWEPEKR